LTKNKIVFLLATPPPVNFSKSYFIEELVNANFLCEVWDLSSIVKKDVDWPIESMNIPIYKLTGLNELVNKVRSNDTSATVFVAQMTPGGEFLIPFLVLSVFNKKTVFFQRGVLPSRISYSAGTNGISKYRKVLKLIFVDRKLKFIFLHSLFLLFSRFNVIKGFDVVFVAGKVAETVGALTAQKMVHIHHRDLDNTHRNSGTQFESLDAPEKYCVFLDDYLPYHSDFVSNNIKTIDAEKYYSMMRSFFDEFEKINNTIVVVAAHPKSSYRENIFGERMIVYDATDVLVKNAVIVMTHASTAISFSIIYNKPVCLLISQEIEETHPNIKQVITSTGKILKCNIYDYEKNLYPKLSEISVDDDAYKFYRRQYLSSIDNSRFSSDIVINEITKLFN
jgi:hypothetical protein